MKKLMKTTFSTIAALLFVASATVVAQQSDYQTQQDFRAEYSELVDRVDNASTPGELEDISADIDALEADYAEYSGIINSAIYPDTFSGRISDLRNRYTSTYNNIRALKDSDERISELMAQIDDYRSRLTQLDEDIADLKEQLDRSATNERRQAALIRQYRQNIEQRDAFVSEVLEQLLTRYQELDSATQSEIADAVERLGDNPVELLKTIITEYTQMADQASGLEAPDYVRMRAQHGYFSDVWSRIGERLSNTFAPNNPVEARQEVSDLLAAWQSSIDNKLWNALTTSFNQNGIELPAFTSAETFNNALNAYVDNAMEVSMESNSEEDYQVFRNFSNYWNNTVKGQWGELLVNGNVLSTSQIAAIDVKLNSWGENAAPTSNLMFILFLISLAVIIGLVVLLITKKS
jgi:predicted  nucleic acid-binding Zn-ribbon protein